MRLPLVALTANAAEEHAAECAASGMDLFICKPLRESALPALRGHAAAAETRDVEAAARATPRVRARAPPRRLPPRPPWRARCWAWAAARRS
jgi:CheY-like chemotaxis protein